MLRSFALKLMCAIVLFCGIALAQAPEAQLPDAPQPQAPPPENTQQPPPSQNPEKKPESKIKRTLKRGAPNCIKIGGMEKCKEASNEGDEEVSEPQQGPQQPRVPQSQPLPRSSAPDESSSKDSQVPLIPPAGEEGSAPGDVQEFHPYDPHKADKNVEVGDFYYKRGNLRAAESRYAEALLYMQNHAAATYKLAEVQEKLGKYSEARANYQQYLKVLPRGEFAAQARKALARLEAQAKDTTSPPAQKRP